MDLYSVWHFNVCTSFLWFSCKYHDIKRIERLNPFSGKFLSFIFTIGESKHMKKWLGCLRWWKEIFIHLIHLKGVLHKLWNLNVSVTCVKCPCGFMTMSHSRFAHTNMFSQAIQNALTAHSMNALKNKILLKTDMTVWLHVFNRWCSAGYL